MKQCNHVKDVVVPSSNPTCSTSWLRNQILNSIDITYHGFMLDGGIKEDLCLVMSNSCKLIILIKVPTSKGHNFC